MIGRETWSWTRHPAGRRCMLKRNATYFVVEMNWDCWPWSLNTSRDCQPAGEIYPYCVVWVELPECRLLSVRSTGSLFVNACTGEWLFGQSVRRAVCVPWYVKVDGRSVVVVLCWVELSVCRLWAVEARVRNLSLWVAVRLRCPFDASDVGSEWGVVFVNRRLWVCWGLN